MEQYNNTPKTPILGRGGFGRVMKWIGYERPNPVTKILAGIVITVLVDFHAPHTSSLLPIGSDNRSKCKIERIH